MDLMRVLLQPGNQAVARAVFLTAGKQVRGGAGLRVSPAQTFPMHTPDRLHLISLILPSQVMQILSTSSEAGMLQGAVEVMCDLVSWGAGMVRTMRETSLSPDSP